MLKRFFPRLLVALLMLAVSGSIRNGNSLSAQTVGFGFNGFVGLPPSVNNNDTVTFGAFVRNNDSMLTYIDTIQINGYIDTGAAHIPFQLPPVPNIQLGAGDSVFFLMGLRFKDHITSGGNFRIGSNVIVVWPILFDPNFGTGDSLTATVFIVDTVNSLGPEHLYDDGIRCYPIPASGPLYVSSNNPTLHPKEITVRDASGKIVAYTDNPAEGIETKEWAYGIYMLEITFDNGAHKVYKVMR